jgi:hypothetical protein
MLLYRPAWIGFYLRSPDYQENSVIHYASEGKFSIIVAELYVAVRCTYEIFKV